MVGSPLIMTEFDDLQGPDPSLLREGEELAQAAQQPSPTLLRHGEQVGHPSGFKPDAGLREMRAKVSPTRDKFKNFLGDFLFSLGRGLEASSQARPGMEGQAGFGASLQAPEELRQKRAAEKQRQLALQDDLARRDLYAKQAAGYNAREQRFAQEAAGKQQVAEGHLALREEGLNIQRTTADSTALKNKYISTAEGIYELPDDGGKPTLVTDAPSKSKITLDQDMVDQLGLPDKFVGGKYNTAELTNLTSAFGKNFRIITGAEGVWAYNLATQEKTKIDKPRPPASLSAPGQLITSVDESGNITNVTRVKPNNEIVEVKGFEGRRRVAKSAELRRMETNAKRGLRVIPNIRKLVEANPNKLILVSIPGSIGARDLRAYKDELTDSYTRINTGAALNKGEQTFYDRYGGTILDVVDSSGFNIRLRLVEETLKDFAGETGFGPTIESIDKATGKKILVKENKKTGKWVKVE